METLKTVGIHLVELPPCVKISNQTCYRHVTSDIKGWNDQTMSNKRVPLKERNGQKKRNLSWGRRGKHWVLTPQCNPALLYSLRHTSAWRPVVFAKRRSSMWRLQRHRRSFQALREGENAFHQCSFASSNGALINNLRGAFWAHW